MQLRRLGATALMSAVLVWPTAVRADAPVVHAAAETAGYTDTDHMAVLTPSVSGRVEEPTRGWALEGSYLVDVISAASVDIVSTASRRWSEVRQAGAIGGSYKPGDLGGSVRASLSSEPDFLSYAAGGTITRDFDERNVSALVGYGYGHDTIGRVGTSFDVFSHVVTHHALTGGVSVVLDAATILSVSSDVTIDSGDPSKPYRYIPLFASDIAPTVPRGASLQVVTRLRLPERVLEQLPLSRDRFALTARLAHRLRHATARLETRAYDDSWNLIALSSDGRYLVDVAPRWAIGPHARYHVQSAVNFWRRAYESHGELDVPALRTGDRELGPLLSLTGGASVRWAVGPRRDPSSWIVSARFDMTYTAFLDDLYIEHRLATVGVLALEAGF